jgi:hypothetical protein
MHHSFISLSAGEIWPQAESPSNGVAAISACDLLKEDNGFKALRNLNSSGFFYFSYDEKKVGQKWDKLKNN